MTGTLVFIKKSFILIELETLINLNWLLFSGLKKLNKEEAKYGAIITLSFINSKTFPFQFPNAWLVLIEASVKFFGKFWEVFFIVSVTGSNTFFYSRENFIHLFCLVIVLLLLDFVVKPALLIFNIFSVFNWIQQL